VQFLTEGIILPDIATSVVFIEHLWLKSPLCLLPESTDLIKQLKDTNFEGQIKALKPYDEVFSIAIPKDAEFNGQKVQGIFVAYMTPDRKREILLDFNKEFGTNAQFNHSGSTDPQLTICYSDPNGPGRIVLNLDLWKLEWVLEAKDIDEYNALTGRSDSTFVAYDLSVDEQITQFEILKFVVSFVVYIGAHADAISPLHDVKIPGSSKQTPNALIHTVKQFSTGTSIKPHYRNLRHEKYYRGKWESWPKGSRWVPVNMSTASVEDVSD
jgi:hypothetical protein